MDQMFKKRDNNGMRDIISGKSTSWPQINRPVLDDQYAEFIELCDNGAINNTGDE